MFTMFDNEFYEMLEELKDQSSPKKQDEPEDEYDPVLEKRIERLDRIFDRMNCFFDFAEDAVDLIGDGISSLLGLDEEAEEKPQHKRFELVSGGVDAKLTDEFFDELERKILFKLDPAYKEFVTNGIPITPYNFKIEDELFAAIPISETGYLKEAVEGYYNKLKQTAVNRWTD